MNWNEAKKINNSKNKYDLPGDWLKIEYFEAINILFRIENSLRVFVYIILKDAFKDKWKELSVTSDDQEQSTINSIAKKRLAQDTNYAYLGYILNSPLLYLTSGELIRIIISESYWKLFKPYFLGTKEIIKNKLDEIGNVRNSVAHFRPLKKGDIELIKQNSIHALSEIENTLVDLISCSHIVPTNTDEQWYKELISLRTNECKFTFRQSIDEKWVKLILWFYCPIITKSNTEDDFLSNIFNLKTDNLLNCFPKLTSLTLCVTESEPIEHYQANEEMQPIKSIRFTFSKECLRKNFKEIKYEFEQIIFEISNEVALIKEDNLARGRVIESKQIFVAEENGKYFIEGDNFITKMDKNTPVEFWGTLNFVHDNFISGTERYPWMPVNVSEMDELPF